MDKTDYHFIELQCIFQQCNIEIQNLPNFKILDQYLFDLQIDDIFSYAEEYIPNSKSSKFISCCLNAIVNQNKTFIESLIKKEQLNLSNDIFPMLAKKIYEIDLDGMNKILSDELPKKKIVDGQFICIGIIKKILPILLKDYLTKFCSNIDIGAEIELYEFLKTNNQEGITDWIERFIPSKTSEKFLKELHLIQKNIFNFEPSIIGEHHPESKIEIQNEPNKIQNSNHEPPSKTAHFLDNLNDKIVADLKNMYDLNQYDDCLTKILIPKKLTQPQGMTYTEQAIIDKIIAKDADLNFSKFFGKLKNYLFDLIKRRRSFYEIIKAFRTSKSEILKNLDVKDLICYLLETCSDLTKIVIGVMIQKQNYPIPFYYKFNNNISRVNFSLLTDLMFDANRPMITFVGTPYSKKCGKTELIFDLHDIDKCFKISEQIGFSHNGSIDIFFYQSIDNTTKGIIADLHGYDEINEFNNILETLFNFSALIVITLKKQDIEQYIEDKKGNYVQKYLNMLEKKELTSFIIIIRDVDDIKDLILNDLFEKKLKAKYEYEYKFLQIIKIPNLRNYAEDKYTLDNIKENVKNNYMDIIKKFQNEKYEVPSIDIIKTYYDCLQNNSKFYDHVENKNKIINDLIPDGKDKNLFSLVLPYLSYKYNVSYKEEIIRKKKLELDEQLVLNKKLEIEIHSLREDLKILKYKSNSIHISPLTKEFIHLLETKNFFEIKKFDHKLTLWKIPKIEPLMTRLRKLNRKNFDLKESPQSTNLAERENIQKEIHQLESTIQDYDLSADKIINEIITAYELNKNIQGSILYEKELNLYLQDTIKKGAPINLICGKTLIYGNTYLSELFSDLKADIEPDEKYFVISVIGAQSSAKSTLLNYLFGCGFQTSDGRCTIGLYCSIIKCKGGLNIIVIDTEGLLSVVARDHLFDNKISVMAFTISHIVIINNKGELTANLKDLIEVTVYALKVMNRKPFKTKLIFALRDHNSDDKQTQSNMVAILRRDIEKIADQLNVNVSENLIFDERDIYLFPNAFQYDNSDNKSIKKMNDKFAFKILELRRNMFDYLVKSQDKYNSLESFYSYAQEVWIAIRKSGQNLLNVQSLLEHQIKQKLEELERSIVEKHRDNLMKEYFHLKNQQFGQNKHKINDFEIEMDKICEIIIEKAEKDFLIATKGNQQYGNKDSWKEECIKKINRDLKYTKFSLSKEFENECNLRLKDEACQGIMSKMEDEFKKILIMSANVDIDARIKQLQEQFERMIEQESSNQRKLIDNIDEKLSCDIMHIYYDVLQIKKKNKLFQGLETFSKIDLKTFRHLHKNELDILNYIPSQFWPCLKSFFKDLFKDKEEAQRVFINKFEEFQTAIKIQAIDHDKESIRKTFNKAFSLIENIAQEIKLSLTWPEFSYDFLYEAFEILFEEERKKYEYGLNQQFKKLKESSEEYLSDCRNLLKSLKDSFSSGKEIATQSLNRLAIDFVKLNSKKIEENILTKIYKKIPDPEAANILAFKESFDKEDFINVYKYCVNINKFIEEIYNKIVVEEQELEIEKIVNKFENEFLELLNFLMNELEILSNLKNDDLNHLTYLDIITNIKNNEQLKIYFSSADKPVNLDKPQQFIDGYKQEISIFKSETNLKSMLSNHLQKNIQEFFANKCRDICGCQEVCPICKNKCSLKNDNHDQHHTNIHICAGLGGVRLHKQNTVTLDNCFSKESIKGSWIYNGIVYKNFDEILKVEKSDWRKEFPNINETDKFKNTVPEIVKKGWIGAKIFFINRYGYLDATPDDWNNLVPKIKCLKINEMTFDLRFY